MMIDVGGERGARARKTEMQREKDGVRERPRARDRERERERDGGLEVLGARVLPKEVGEQEEERRVGM